MNQGPEYIKESRTNHDILDILPLAAGKANDCAFMP